MKSIVKRFFTLNLFIMRYLGFYPPASHKKTYKMFANMVYCLCTVPVPTLAAVYLLVSENVNLTQVGDSCFIIFQVGCFIFKMLPFIHNADEIRASIYMMENWHFTRYNKKQEEFIEKCAKICKRNTWLFVGFCIVSWTLWGVTPFFDSQHNFPIEIWLPFDPTAQTLTYIAVYTFISLGVGNGAVSNGVLDPLVAGLACYASYQLRILKDNLQYLSEYAEEKLLKSVCREIEEREKNILKSKIIYEKIKECIQHQNAIYSFVQNYEDKYSSVVFIQFAASILVICVSCLQLSLVEPFTFPFFTIVTFISTMLIEIFLYSYFGTTLFEESSSLATAVYMGQWYDYDIKSKKALIVLTERSKRPVVVTAGKIVDVSLTTFTTILRRAYSLFAVLKNYNN